MAESRERKSAYLIDGQALQFYLFLLFKHKPGFHLTTKRKVSADTLMCVSPSVSGNRMEHRPVIHWNGLSHYF